MSEIVQSQRQGAVVLLRWMDAFVERRAAVWGRGS
jgi:hypothetical protein